MVDGPDATLIVSRTCIFWLDIADHSSTGILISSLMIIQVATISDFVVK